ncbi:MAG TPA: phospholipase D-like domain-containing protein [Planctomycetota bacterium]|nr:phospholipase D-like domain-containing protein [Planctomycetota bacterium]
MLEGRSLPEIILWSCAIALGVTCAGHALLIKRRNPSGALIWVVFCLTVPYFAPFLYLTFGHDRLTRRRRRRIRAAHREFYNDVQQRRSQRRQGGGELSCPVPALFRLCEGDVLGGNAVDVLIGGHAAYDRMCAVISHAVRHVYLQTFIFDADDAGRRFIDVLSERAQAGVRVRVLYDPVGTSRAGARLIRSLTERGGDAKVAAFLPFHPLKRRWQVNLRNHRKILAVDDEHGFLGSMNVSARHFAQGPTSSHDLVLHVRGPVVRDMTDVFSADWRFAAGERLQDDGAVPPPAGNETLQLVESGPDHVDRGVFQLLVAAIYAARRDILVLTPYFIPPPELLTALQTAAARGISVRLVVPGKQGQWLMHLATRSYLSPLLREGVKVAERPGTLMHMKLLVVDDAVAVVGSTNLDYRSFFLNFEADFVVYGGELQRRLRETAEAEWRASTPMPEGRFEKLPLAERLAIRAAALFSPVL